MAVLAMTASAEAVVLIDFGHQDTQTASEELTGPVRYWNNVHNSGNATTNQPYGATPALSLINTDQTDSGIDLKISNTATGGNNLNRGFDSQNINGLNPTAGNALARGYATTATQDSLFGYTISSASFAHPTGNVTLTLSGLQAGEVYNFFGFAARNGVTDNREVLYSFQGAGAPVNVEYQTASNTAGNTFASGDVVADLNGVIALTVSPGNDNNNSNRFTYLGVLEIVPQATVPEPATATLLAMGGLAMLARRRK
ncbi:MAG TPA: PEP-CTERM sorting domain-containing protein [Tepidisphaeraceae bacterium]|nr:PEP-CTERM sorting domain-containing protein [Tepidisphaeraceae bacterium]